ncbi:hypothetical protein PAECIP111893_00652 [Paenibacillus plantiphilus]|uniref:Uncharacterized protein n=1 Tax=Paenibacillus plantiphilus TaxID=2905650 RepID=A0ABM9BWH6_9BACL|nr:hypothetical protein [Paenibacillus plantiphilus]CAH1195257.1 hypothetical protein PAECIP111893_00652 [Paenibacillus plantiphilus]
MVNILRVNGFYNKSVFFVTNDGDKNIYYLDNDDSDDKIAGFINMKFIIHDTTSNTVETYDLPYPAEDFSRQFGNKEFYYARFSHEKAFLHIHRVEFCPVRSSEIAVSLTEVLGGLNVYRTVMQGIDDRYCLVGCSTTRTYETTHMLLIDFDEQTYYSIAPDFGIDTLCRIESFMTMKSTQLTPGKEEIALIIGGFHWTEKYEIWENRESWRDLEDKLMEHVVIFDRDSFFRRLKSGLPLEVTDKQIIERCALHRTIISYGDHGTKMDYTMVDFENKTTTRVEYDIHSGKKTLFEHESILSSPVYIDGELYSIETLDDERFAVLDLRTNQFLVILTSNEKILAVDKHFILTYKWLENANQQIVYIYDLDGESVEQQLLGIGYAHYDGKQVTIFS